MLKFDSILFMDLKTTILEPNNDNQPCPYLYHCIFYFEKITHKKKWEEAVARRGHARSLSMKSNDTSFFHTIQFYSFRSEIEYYLCMNQGV